MVKAKSQKRDRLASDKSTSTRNKKSRDTSRSSFGKLISKYGASAHSRLAKSPHGWYFVTFGLLCLYMLIFQLHFVLSGDIWAEAFPEYVNEAVTLHWRDVLQPSWAGYLTIIPSFFSKLYVYIGFPLGYVDHYLRAVGLIFAISCVSFIAHPINRRLITSDLLRVALSFIFMLSLMHVSILAFINIWYAGFIVVALVSLSGKKLSTKWEWIYTIFATAVILSKSSLVLLPLVIYRALTTKRYLQGSLLSIAILLQTYLTVFAANGYGSDKLNSNIIEIVRDLLLGVSVLAFKLINLPLINHFTIIMGLAILVGIMLTLWFRKGWLMTCAISLSLAMALYLHIFAPDNNFKNVWTSYAALYGDSSKLQREFFISFLLLIVGGVFASIALQKISKIPKYARLSKISVIAFLFLIVIGMGPLTKIDISSPGVSTDISSFRSSLNNERSVCMPVPPTPALDYHAAWFFQYKGGCYLNQSPETFNLTDIRHPISSAGMQIAIDSSQKEDLKTVLMPIVKTPFTKNILTLTDLKTGKSSEVTVPGNDQEVVFISFNLESLSLPSEPHNFILKSQTGAGEIKMGYFKSGKPLLYSYFIGKP